MNRGRPCGVAARPVACRGPPGEGLFRRGKAAAGRGRAGAARGRGPARRRGAPGRVPGPPSRSGAGHPVPGPRDVLPHVDDRGRMRGRQRRPETASGPGVRVGPGDRALRPSLGLSADDLAAGEHGRRAGPAAHGEGHGGSSLHIVPAGARTHRARHRRYPLQNPSKHRRSTRRATRALRSPKSRLDGDLHRGSRRTSADRGPPRRSPSAHPSRWTSSAPSAIEPPREGASWNRCGWTTAGPGPARPGTCRP